MLGSFYTPQSLATAIVEDGLRRHLAERFADRATRSTSAQTLLRICDPMCGSGNLLVPAAESYARALIASDSTARHNACATMAEALSLVLRTSIYGVDVDETAVQEARARLVGLYQRARRETAPDAAPNDAERVADALERHVIVGDSIISPLEHPADEPYPRAAYRRREGDDAETVRAWRAQANRARNALEATVRGDTAERATASDDTSTVDRWMYAFTVQRVPSAPSPFDDGVGLDEAIAEQRRQIRWLDWRADFPDVWPAGSPGPRSIASWSRRDRPTGGFDIVLANPPFVNAIERRPPAFYRPLTKTLYPGISGAADVSHLALVRGAELLAPGGALSYVLPRSALAARPLDGVRATLAETLGLDRIRLIARSDLFDGAAVHVATVTLGSSRSPMVASTDDGLAESWCPIPARLASSRHATNWWFLAQQALRASQDESTQDKRAGESLGGAAPRVRDRFEVSASMTAGDAYDIKPYVVDERDGERLRLVTTGLIDPDTLLWGKRRCRYLGRDLSHPRVIDDPSLPSALRNRLRRARRPKLLVAGLAKRIEAYVDTEGSYIGAVATWTITHPDDDVDALGELAAHLHAEDTTALFYDLLGANALGGGSVRMDGRFLEELSLPASLR